MTDQTRATRMQMRQLSWWSWWSGLDLAHKITISQSERRGRGENSTPRSRQGGQRFRKWQKWREARRRLRTESAKAKREAAKSVGDGKREILMGVSASVVVGIPKQRGAKMSAERKFNSRNLTKDVPCREDKTWRKSDEWEGKCPRDKFASRRDVSDREEKHHVPLDLRYPPRNLQK